MNKIQNFKKFITKLQLGEATDNASFKELTSIKVGGSCELLFKPFNLETLVTSVKYLKENQIPYFIIGKGTNLLVNDRHFELVLINLEKLNNYFILDEDDNEIYIYVEAGVNASTISKYLLTLGLSGGEFLSVIPGSIGGITYMNAGAYKRSISELIYSITYCDEKGSLQTVLNKNNNFAFNYRTSSFHNTTKIITSIVLRILKETPGENPKEKVKRYLNLKRQSQPLQTYNAGSTFKNNNNCFTWQIIDKLGYRGYKLGGAMVSDKHANFIINYDNASFLDIITLIKMIEYDAKIKLNIDLECEWEILQ